MKTLEEGAERKEGRTTKLQYRFHCRLLQQYEWVRKVYSWEICNSVTLFLRGTSITPSNRFTIPLFWSMLNGSTCLPRPTLGVIGKVFRSCLLSIAEEAELWLHQEERRVSF